MLHPIQLIVGLSNPGKEYAETRHNAGAWFIENIAANADRPLHFEGKFKGSCGKFQIHQQVCHLLIPATFMNLSGQSVSAMMAYHKIPREAVLIAHDDIDLPVGAIRLKLDGGDGGHNGLKDIIRHLHSKQFYRLRIGVGRPVHSADVVDYVLNSPSKSDRQKINQGLLQAADALPLIVSGQIAKAMQILHTSSQDEAP